MSRAAEPGAARIGLTLVARGVVANAPCSSRPLPVVGYTGFPHWGSLLRVAIVRPSSPRLAGVFSAYWARRSGVTPMPTFIDRHSLAAVPSVIQRQMHLEATHGLLDPSGAKPVAHWVEDGVIYCLLEAPDREAVCAHHACRGLPCDDVHLIPGLRESRPTSRQEQAIVRAAIDGLWHSEGPLPQQLLLTEIVGQTSPTQPVAVSLGNGAGDCQGRRRRGGRG